MPVVTAAGERQGRAGQHAQCPDDSHIMRTSRRWMARGAEGWKASARQQDFSKNASARGSFDCPSQNIAWRRTAGLEWRRGHLDQLRHALVLRQLARARNSPLLDVGVGVALDGVGNRRDGLRTGALGDPEQGLAAHLGRRARLARRSTSAARGRRLGVHREGGQGAVDDAARAGSDPPGETSSDTLCGGCAPSSHTTGSPPASIAHPSENVRTRVTARSSTRAKTNSVSGPSSFTECRPATGCRSTSRRACGPGEHRHRVGDPGRAVAGARLLRRTFWSDRYRRPRREPARCQLRRLRGRRHAERHATARLPRSSWRPHFPRISIR